MCAWSRGDVRRNNWVHAGGGAPLVPERLREGTIGRGQGERGAACRRPFDHAVSKTSPKATGCPCAGPCLCICICACPAHRSPCCFCVSEKGFCRSPLRACGAQKKHDEIERIPTERTEKKKRDPTRARRHVSPRLAGLVSAALDDETHISSDDDMSSVHSIIFLIDFFFPLLLLNRTGRTEGRDGGGEGRRV